MDDIPDSVLSLLDLNQIENFQQYGNFNLDANFDLALDPDLQERMKARIPKKNRQANGWFMKIWAEWANARNIHANTKKDPHFPVPLDLSSASLSTLDYWMSRFILEIGRADGKPYPPKTLQQIASAIQRHLRVECNRPEIMLFRKEYPCFHSFRLALDSRMKELTALRSWNKPKDSRSCNT